MNREVVRQVLFDDRVSGDDDALIRPVAVEQVAEPGQQVVVFGGGHDEDLQVISPNQTIAI